MSVPSHLKVPDRTYVNGPALGSLVEIYSPPIDILTTHTDATTTAASIKCVIPLYASFQLLKACLVTNTAITGDIEFRMSHNTTARSVSGDDFTWLVTTNVASGAAWELDGDPANYVTIGPFDDATETRSHATYDIGFVPGHQRRIIKASPTAPAFIQAHFDSDGTGAATKIQLRVMGTMLDFPHPRERQYK